MSLCRVAVRGRVPAAFRRLLAAGAGVLVLLAVLSACDKPKPTVTMLSNDHATVVPAQPACTIQQTDTCALDVSKQRTISARSGSQILLDVSPQLSDSGYVVAAYTTDGKTNTPLTTPGASTGAVHNKLALRLAVPSQSQGSYYLQVSALAPSRRLTTWLVLVQLTA